MDERETGYFYFYSPLVSIHQLAFPSDIFCGVRALFCDVVGDIKVS